MRQILIGLVIGLLIGLALEPGHAAAIGDRQQPDLPAGELVIVTNTPQPTNTPVVTKTPAQLDLTPTVTTQPTLEAYPGIKINNPVTVTTNITLGLTGAAECWNCAPFQPSFKGEPVQVKLSNYTPWAGGPNCWDWDKDFEYCMSETRSGLSWEEFYGFSAACPEEWPHGSWIAVEGVGAFICLDTGNEVVCHDGNEDEIKAGNKPHCHVDILGPSGSWNQQYFDATLWVSLNPRR